MDEINDFFDFSKDFQRIQAPRGIVSSVASTSGKDDVYKKPPKRELASDDYIRKAVAEEEKKLQLYDPNIDVSNVSTLGISRMDVLSDDEDDEMEENGEKARDPVYDMFFFNYERDESLAIYEHKDNIIETMRSTPVIVLEGDTGCGKTTQVPQYILDDCHRRNEYCNIVVTQPRRIAAISIASRVASERRWEMGTVIGHQVGLNAKVSPYTRLLYCTTGVLLQKLIRQKSLEPYTHIILDEVHERDQDMDFLLIVIRRLLATTSPKVKVILMSATINSSEFANYFKIKRKPAPIVRCDSRRLFKVSEYYLNEIRRLNQNDVDVEFDSPGIQPEMYKVALKLILVIDNIEKEEAALNERNSRTSMNSVLIFLPGINEIEYMNKEIEKITHQTGNDNVKLCPLRLHSMISSEEQMHVFQRQAPGYRKIILSTNIAESSITVPDVKYVIDFCLSKSLYTDTNTNFTSLQLHWASKANCRQRSGRAGRVMNGRVYRLVSRDFYENMDDFAEPEMLRAPLENLVLKAKLLNMGPPPSILGLALNPPNLTNITNTIMILKEVGAFYTYMQDGSYNPEDGEITYMGRIMAALPLNIRLTRFIVLGHIFSVLNEAIIMAAGLSVRSIFQSVPKRNQRDVDIYRQKLYFADGSGSDLFAIYKAYTTWVTFREQHNLDEKNGEEHWAAHFHINLRQMREMHLLVDELQMRLLTFKMKIHDSVQGAQWLDHEKTTVIKIIIAGAFYPYYFTRSNLNDVDHERAMYHKLCENDPCRTVYLTGFNSRNIGHLYVPYIKDLFKHLDIHPRDIEVRFQPSSEHIFIIFKSDPEEEESNINRIVMPGSVLPAVYMALRLRYAKTPLVLNVMDPRAALKYVKENNIGRIKSDGSWEPKQKQTYGQSKSVLPTITEKSMRGNITHIINCSQFYFQPVSETDHMRRIVHVLNTDEAKSMTFSRRADVSKDMYVAAPLDNIYHRAKVLNVISTRQNLQFKVFFIDFGKTKIIPFDNLRNFNPNASFLWHWAPRCMECRLAMVEPSNAMAVVKKSLDKWNFEANDLLMRCADAGTVELEIFSIVSNVVNVILPYNSSTLNQRLVDEGYARKSEENYMSKTDHGNRTRIQMAVGRMSADEYRNINDTYIGQQQIAEYEEITPPSRDLCVKTNILRGPFSPLETKLYSAIRAGTWKTVEIERDSVNSVLLDTDPHDMHERMLVASSLTEHPYNQSLTARATSLMPNIHGFGALMTMLFCPRLQIKRNKTKTKYVTILAGLGYDAHTYEPLFEEHDIVLNLDVNIMKIDIEQINTLRYSMDSIIYSRPEEEFPTITQDSRANFQSQIKDLIIKLLNKNRKYIENHVDGNDHIWEALPVKKGEVLVGTNLYGKRALFPTHEALELYAEPNDHRNVLIENCRELHRLCNLNNFANPISCLLCNQTLENNNQLRLHLLTQLHIDREQQIKYQQR